MGGLFGWQQKEMSDDVFPSCPVERAMRYAFRAFREQRYCNQCRQVRLTDHEKAELRLMRRLALGEAA